MITERVAVTNQFAVDENDHMLPNSSLFVEDITSCPLVFTKVIIEHGA